MQAIESWVEQTLQAIGGQARLPESTYRLQFHAGFTFADARAILPYLHDLGITHCYASPYLKAKPGSMHGYDVIDHGRLNPELGDEADYIAWTDGLRARGMGHILDIVPNHMGIATNDNAWWNDVLLHGPASRYARHFDIDWRGSPRPELHDKLLLPTLGSPYAQVLEKGELRLEHEHGVFSITYYERRLPVNPGSYGQVLAHRLDELENVLGAEHPAMLEYRSILAAIAHLPSPSRRDPARAAHRHRETRAIQQRLARIQAEHAQVRQFIADNVERFNGAPGDPLGFDLLHDLLEAQSYRLAYWRLASDEINYRRFFDVNELAALSMERQEVFRAAHALVLQQLAEGRLDGLRIDHPDGLYDPEQYFVRLQREYILACAHERFRSDPPPDHPDWSDVAAVLLQRLETIGRPLYVVAEKILAGDEPLPESWAVHGTSGYDFLHRINALFVDPAHAADFTRLYHEWTGEEMDFEEVVYQKKRLILRISLASELRMLAHRLDRLAQADRRWRDYSVGQLHRALREVIACFPVYRCYACERGIADADRPWIETAIHRAIARNPTMDPGIFHFIADVLLLRFPERVDEALRERQRQFVGKFQQVTAPATAKGVEDTAFYVYNRLVSLNEVGGDPGEFGTPPERLHSYLQERQAKWPHSLSPLSTHDTKRSEDVRARINVLSEMPEAWWARMRHWSEINRPHRQDAAGAVVPHANVECLLYQTLVGVWPLEPYTPEEYSAFVGRIQAYMLKAQREAKVYTNWTAPDPAFESALERFIARILDEQSGRAFLEDLRAFLRPIAHFGLLNSLSQTLLRLTAPGVPDTYQGSELWDFSLVDPDNRRPVDYQQRRALLEDLGAQVHDAGDDRRAMARALADNLADPRIKLFVIWQALHSRRRQPGLFTTGVYLPIEPAGRHARHIFAFARRHEDRWALVVVPRFFTPLVPGPPALPTGDLWADTALRLPEEMPADPLRNAFTGEPLVTIRNDTHPPTAPLAQILSTFPVALFTLPASPLPG